MEHAREKQGVALRQHRQLRAVSAFARAMDLHERPQYHRQAAGTASARSSARSRGCLQRLEVDAINELQTTGAAIGIRTAGVSHVHDEALQFQGRAAPQSYARANAQLPETVSQVRAHGRMLQGVTQVRNRVVGDLLVPRQVDPRELERHLHPDASGNLLGEVAQHDAQAPQAHVRQMKALEPESAFFGVGPQGGDAPEVEPCHRP
mmetsp:Transcript_292/g.810  ORF Transcript_292/g.810 Transcript_292/m.810 type:complete len:206 (-) Transcript_292:1098-1715(-)